MLIQWQRFDSDGQTNLGGLYIERNQIAAVYCDRREDGRHLCRMAMASGVVYTTVQSISEVLDDIARHDGKER